MDLPLPDPAIAAEHAQPLTQRFRRAAWISLGFVALLWWIKLFEHWMGQPFDALALRPHDLDGLIGILTAPLLHASLEHIGANSLPLLILGTLAGGLYPRATLRALPVIWVGSGIGVWFTGESGSAHIGASGIAHGLMFLVFALGVLRRDRQAIAAGMIAFFLYGGMLLTIFPREVNISWESHLFGAICGVLAAIIWRHCDPALPRKRYSWEDEPDDASAFEDDALESPILEKQAAVRVDALSQELSRGTAETAWVENDWDGELDLNNSPDFDGDTARSGPPPTHRDIH